MNEPSFNLTTSQPQPNRLSGRQPPIFSQFETRMDVPGEILWILNPSTTSTQPSLTLAPTPIPTPSRQGSLLEWGCILEMDLGDKNNAKYYES
jgi:hypothetical protein